MLSRASPIRSPRGADAQGVEFGGIVERAPEGELSLRANREIARLDLRERRLVRIAGDSRNSQRALRPPSRARLHSSAVSPPRTPPVSLNGRALVLVPWPLSG